MNKKLLCMAATAIAIGCASSVKVSAMAIPSHSIVIGSKAYSIDYVVKPANYGEINSAILNASNVYYVINSNTIKDLFSNSYVSTNVIDSISTINYKDKTGEEYIARGGSDYLEHVPSPFMATATVDVGNGLSILKKINVNSITVPNARYYSVGENSYIKQVGTAIQTTLSGNSANIYFYGDSSGNSLIATGTIDVSTSSGVGGVPVSNLQYAMGNSSGNINNMGLVATDLDNQWIYYRGTGGDLFKVKSDGVDRTQLTLGNDAKYINVVGNQVYYVHTNPATKTSGAISGIYRMKVDGSDAVVTQSGTTVTKKTGNLIFSSSSTMNDVIAVGDYIYYINDSDGSLHRFNVNSNYDSIISSTDKYTDINIVKNYLYAINTTDKNKIYKINLNTLISSKVSDVQAKHLNVADGWIYYRNYADGEKLYRMNLDATENDKLCDDIVYNLNVCKDTVYYKDGSDANKLYMIGADGTGGQQVITPVPKTMGAKLSNDVVEYVNVINNTVYYSPASMGSLTSILKDGSGKTIMK